MGWGEEVAGGARGADQSLVKGCEGAIESLGESHVPCVVTGQVVPQCPYTLGKWAEGEQFQVELQQVAVGGCSFRAGNTTGNIWGQFKPTQDVEGFGRNQLGPYQGALSQYGFRPEAVISRVYQGRDKDRRIDNDGH